MFGDELDLEVEVDFFSGGERAADCEPKRIAAGFSEMGVWIDGSLQPIDMEVNIGIGDADIGSKYVHGVGSRKADLPLAIATVSSRGMGHSIDSNPFDMGGRVLKLSIDS